MESLYDKAFDKGLIGIDTQFRVILSSEIRDRTTKAFYHNYFGKIEGEPIQLPQKYLPQKEFLQFHLDTVYKV